MDDNYKPLTCAWMGRGKTDCCSKEVIPGRSYCEEHLWTVYQKGSNLAKRKKELRIVDDIRLLEQLFNEAVEELEAEGFL